MLIFPTYQTILTKTSTAASSIITDGLRLSYDFSNTDCWNGNTSSNVADYTVNNLAGNHNDAFIRDYVGSGYTNTSNSSYIELSSAGGGSLYTKGDNSSAPSSRGPIAVLAGAYSGTTSTVANYNLTTVAGNNTDNLFNGVGNDDWTWEMWVRSASIASSTNSLSDPLFFLLETTAGANRLFRARIRPTTSSHSAAGKWKVSYYDYSSWDNVLVDIATGQQANWTNWTHFVISRQGTGSDDVKVYINNTLEKTFTGADNISHLEYAWIGGKGGTYNLDTQLGIVRMYKGKALSASEVTTHWNAEKARFGY